MYKQVIFAIAAALLLTAFVTMASASFTPQAHAQNATGGGNMTKNATSGAAGNATAGAGANATK